MPAAADDAGNRSLKDGNDDDGAAAVVVPPAGSGTEPAPRRTKAVAAALAGGVGTAALGTALHGHIWHVRDAALPIGAVAAVVLAVCVAVYVALWARNVLVAALTGVVAYVLVGVAASMGAGGFIAAGVEVNGVAPPVAVAGTVWVVGLAVGTVAAVAVSWRVLRQSARPSGPGSQRRDLD
ncbi:hypothetical protein GC088_10755 [Arthrobacter sp. JZ12]|uniref:hypothetical protein n=1 Tax=Arthrobacter sp. JZ12 TaxID=2654190 RepID=UPI002B467E2A|nr:hypothetical protein [Arthrobacter sp. JZ12]WRH25496.1 hypothetical protein GC088_10755 [Arthrobacter sp. JZ12]